jgi:hypothetical protein
MITAPQRDRVERECATRQMVAGTGKEGEMVGLRCPPDELDSAPAAGA